MKISNPSGAQVTAPPELDITVSNQREAATEAYSLIKKAWIDGNRRPQHSLQLLNQSFEMSRQTGYTWGVAKSLQLSAIICSHTGRYDEGIAFLQHLIYYCLATGKHTDLLGSGYNVIGNIYQSLGKYEEAAYYYHQALQLPVARVRESTVGLIYTNLAELSYKIKQQAQALQYLNRAEEIARRNRNHDVRCIIQSTRGRIYADMNLHDSAKHFYREAQQLIRTYHRAEYDILDIEYSNLTYLAELWLNEGKADSAAPCIRRIEQIRTPVQPLRRNKAYLVTGRYHLAVGDYKKAEHYLLMALKSAERIHIGNDLANIHLGLSDLYAAQGDFGRALRYKDRYIQLKDSLEGQEIARDVQQLEIRYRTAEKDKELISQKLTISQHKSEMREKNLWMGIIAAGMVVLVIVSAALYKKRQADRRLQQKEIHILKQQQEAMQREQEIERLKAMMKGEEQERTRLARELHDGIGGMLTAIKMNLSAARKKYPELARFDPLTEITFMLEDTGAEIRKTAHNLMPDVLVRKRLPEALMIYCEQITAHDQLQIDLQFHGAFDQLTKATELMLYRIIQELLQNILKHANATHAVVQLREYEGKLSLTVEDNGEGFDTEAQSGGFGLLNLRYRVAALQGHISIMSAKGRHTTIHLEFDLENLKMAGT
jgi:signal transduction histidine kinase